MTNELVTANENFIIESYALIPEKLFEIGGMDSLLLAIQNAAKGKKFDMDKPKDRTALRAFAAKFGKSKTFIDLMGKNLKEQYMAKIRPIDQERKKFRDTMDTWKNKIRQPLTEWEDEQAKIKAETEALEKFNAAHTEAIPLNEIFDREREIQKKEVALAKLEAKRKAKEKADRLEKEKLIREKIKADKKAEDAIKAKELMQIQAKIDAENAERKRLQDIQAEQKKAEDAKLEAINRQKFEQAEKKRKERERLEALKRIEDGKKAKKEHRKTVNQRLNQALIEYGMSESFSKKLIDDIILEKFPNLKIIY
jgi:colicin import membrane protein